MRTKRTSFVATIMRGKLHIFAAIIALFPALGWSQEYTVTNLGTLGGHTSNATSVNNKGQVGGQSTLPGESVTDPFLYANGSMIDLGNFGGNIGSAIAVNDEGLVAGSSSGPDGIIHAFLWTAGALQDLAPGMESQGWAMNAIGEVAGNIIATPGLWLGGQFEPISFAPYAEFTPFGINNAGMLMGECSVDQNSETIGCSITGNTVQALQPLAGYANAHGMAINSPGQICGASFHANQSRTAVLWKSVLPIDLGAPPMAHDSVCTGLDDFGQAVGNAYSGSKAIGVRYDPLNGAQDLNKLIPQFFRKGQSVQVQDAVALSNSGYIAADCLIGGRARACLLTPNPVYILQQNVLGWANAEVVCVPCQTSLIPEAKSLPKSLDGLNADQREIVLGTVDKIGIEIESLERSRKISQPDALLLIHEAQLVVAALEPRD